MATWPATGDTDWNTKMLAYLAIGHETDGTHNQEDWTPTAYAGGQSITFPNGLILKTGRVARAGAETEVVYDTAFPNACLSINVTAKDTGDDDFAAPIYVKHGAALSTISVVMRTSSAVDVLMWTAWGY